MPLSSSLPVWQLALVWLLPPVQLMAPAHCHATATLSCLKLAAVSNHSHDTSSINTKTSLAKHGVACTLPTYTSPQVPLKSSLLLAAFILFCPLSIFMPCISLSVPAYSQHDVLVLKHSALGAKLRRKHHHDLALVTRVQMWHNPDYMTIGFTPQP